MVSGERVVSGEAAGLGSSGEAPEARQDPGGPGWSVHTWSTFIARAEEEEVVAPQGKTLLSTFQRDKFVHFFYHVLDVNR